MARAQILDRLQSKAARALLGWSQERLAEQAGVSQTTVASFEAGLSVPVKQNLLAIRRALEEAGVDIIDENGGGLGARLRKPVQS